MMPRAQGEWLAVSPHPGCSLYTVVAGHAPDPGNFPGTPLSRRVRDSPFSATSERSIATDPTGAGSRGEVV